MKTIEEIFQENGSTFPFDVKRKTWDDGFHFHIVARSPGLLWLGWISLTNATDSWVGNTAEWSLYIPPKPKKILYEWMIKTNSYWLIADALFSEEQVVTEWPCIEYKKTGRQFEVDDV